MAHSRSHTDIDWLASASPFCVEASFVIGARREMFMIPLASLRQYPSKTVSSPYFRCMPPKYKVFLFFIEGLSTTQGQLWAFIIVVASGVQEQYTVTIWIVFVQRYSVFFVRNELTALGRAVSFEACCQWALLSVQITRLVTLRCYLLYRSTFILLSVKCMLGIFVFP